MHGLACPSYLTPLTCSDPQAAAELAGPDALLHVLCTGAGAGGGGLALLCGPWAAMQVKAACSTQKG